MEALDYGLLRAIVSVVVFAAFVGLVFWAYSGRRARDFDEAARLPLEDDVAMSGDSNSNNKTEETRHD
jgi:cytochrome c oxidase cbb3-type subunit 4